MILKRFFVVAATLYSVCGALEPFPTYKAFITEVPGTESGVQGTVVVFVDGDTTTTGYAGIVGGLESLLNTVGECNATNGCGVHIHSGFSCENTTLQEGHYFADPVVEDPWVEARYTSDDAGMANFAGTLEIGTDDVEGRAFIVHAEDGSRVGCGLLQRIPDDDLLVTETDALTDDAVVSTNTILAVGASSCFFGSAEGLESGLLSFLNGGDDCNATNGCGVHIHSGVSCANSTLQEGHLYNAGTMTEDPWELIGYSSTSSDGTAYYTGCVETGVSDFEGRAFIVHFNDGSRGSCGLLKPFIEASEDESFESSTASIFLSTSALSIMALVFFHFF